MKKIIIVTLCAALMMSLPAFALELSPDAAGKVPATYAKVKGGKIVYSNKTTAYSPDTLNAILEAYGLKLTSGAVANVPASYAKVKDGGVAFGKKSTAYRPNELHAILTAYGLTLSPEDVRAKLGSTDYAKVSGGKIVFGKRPAAYSGKTLSSILGAYAQPVVAVTPEPTPAPEPVPAPTPVPAPEPVPAPVDTDVDTVPDERDECPGTPAGVKVDERGCWVLNLDYLFDFDKAVIRSEYYSALDDVVRVLNENPALRVELQGHTDSIGAASYNMTLSKKRAKAVRIYLIERGIDSSRLSARGFGESRPIESNATREGRAKNRRVELNPMW